MYGTQWDSSHFLFRVIFFCVKIHYLMTYSMWLCSKWIIFVSTSQIFHFWNKVCGKKGEIFLCLTVYYPPLYIVYSVHSLIVTNTNSFEVMTWTRQYCWNVPIMVGDDINVHKATVCHVIRDVTHYIALLTQNFINMPNYKEEKMLCIY